MVSADLVNVDDASNQEEKGDGVFDEGKWYIPRKNIETVLIIGVDKYEAEMKQEGYHNAQQADFLMLIILDNEKGTYSAVHLNRDTMASIPLLGVEGEEAGSFVGQLALSHTYGRNGKERCQNTVETVSNLLYGVEINHYISFTMEAVAKINDAVGGVSVVLLDDFTSYDPTMRKGAEVNLTGNMSLAYVRSRKELEDSSNLKRMQRQEQYLTALQDDMKACIEKDANFPMETLGMLSEYMVSDCTVNGLKNLYEKSATYKNMGMINIEGEAMKGNKYIEFHADQDLLKKMVIDIFYEEYSLRCLRDGGKK